MASRIRQTARTMKEDAIEMARARGWKVDRRALLRIVTTDPYRVLALQRLRELSLALRLPLLNHLFRRRQTSGYGAEISKHATIGRGVYIAHPVGVVIGGDSRVGDRVIFYGGNTLGAMEGSDYPIVEDDVALGAGARVLGKVRIGARARIGANAVVLADVPPDSVAVGVPAKVISTGKGAAVSSLRDPAAGGRVRS